MIFNIVILAMEVLYYSLFMKFAKRKGKFWKYILGFIIVTIIGTIINTNNLISYLILNILIILSLKYIVRIKIVSYDLFTIFLMLFTKIIIEYVVVLIFYNLLKLPIFIVLILISLLKLLIIVLFKNKIYLINKYFNRKWNNNNFYIRYIFTILMFIYVIVSFITIIFY